MNRYVILILIFGIPLVGLGYGITLPENDSSPVLTVFTPYNSSSKYNFTALSAIQINASKYQNPSCLFCSGIYLITNATKVDFGRGMIINNFGVSDALYIENEGHNGPGGTGIAILNDRNGNIGLDIGNRANATGLLLEQDTNKASPSENLATIQNIKNVPVEMMRFNTAYDGSVGIIFRMSLVSTPIAVKDTLGNDVADIYNDGTIHAKNGYRLESPNGTQYIIKVHDDGSLFTCKKC